jgi:hypothetical protein
MDIMEKKAKAFGYFYKNKGRPLKQKAFCVTG